MSAPFLPVEILSEVLSHVPKQSILSLRLVNSIFESLIKPSIQQAWPEPYNVLSIPRFVPPNIADVVIDLTLVYDNPERHLSSKGPIERRLNANVKEQYCRTLVLHIPSDWLFWCARALETFGEEPFQRLAAPGGPLQGLVNLEVSFLAFRDLSPWYSPNDSQYMRNALWDFVDQIYRICPAIQAFRLTQEVGPKCKTVACANNWVASWLKLSSSKSIAKKIRSFRMDIRNPKLCACDRVVFSEVEYVRLWRSKIVWPSGLVQLTLSCPPSLRPQEETKPFRLASFFLRFVLQNDSPCISLTVLELVNVGISYPAPIPDTAEACLSPSNPCAFPNLVRLTLLDVYAAPFDQDSYGESIELFTSIFADLPLFVTVEVGASSEELVDVWHTRRSISGGEQPRFFQQVLQAKETSLGWNAVKQLSISALVAHRIVSNDSKLWQRLPETFVLQPLSMGRDWTEESWKR